MSAGRPRPPEDVAERILAEGGAAPVCPACRYPAIAHKGAWQCGQRDCRGYGEVLGVALVNGYELGDVGVARARALAAGNERRRLEAEADHAYKVALDVALEELDRDGLVVGPGGRTNHITIADTARRAGIHRSTIYNELERRQERRDQLGPQDPPPAPAPADTDLKEVPNA